MDIETALQIINRQIPCGHHTIDTNLGNGLVWAKCEDCGDTFEQERLPNYRKAESDFDTAIEVIRKGLKNNKKLQTGRLRCLASPCPCTAVKMNRCHDWCRFYPPTAEL